MFIRWHRWRIPRALAVRLFIWCGIILIATVVLLIVVDRASAPALMDMAETKVRALTVKAMNDAVRRVMAEPLKYSDLIKVTEDGDGRVTMIQADTVKLNDIATSAALTTQGSIAEFGKQGIGVPAGSLLGGELFAGRGPDIYAKIVPVGDVITEFNSEFQNQGINQTRHKIYLELRARVRIVVPTQSKEIDVLNRVLVTECIIIGEVPASYVNVAGLDDLNAVAAANALGKNANPAN